MPGLSAQGMTRTLVIGASGGIGAAIRAELEARGGAVVGLSRSGDGLDLAEPGSIARVLGDVEGPFDGIVLATGVLAPEGAEPEKALSAIDAGEMARVMAVNAIGPALVLAHAERLIPKDRVAVIGVLSARVGSIGDNRIGGWHSYRASKAALNQIVRGAAIELRRKRPLSCVVALHPGTVETSFTADYAGRHKTVPAAEAAQNLVDLMSGLGPGQTGRFFAYDGKEILW